MKNLKIISKNEALGRLAKSIKSGTRLSPYPLNTQSYTWIDEKLYIGREVCVMDNVDCVYFERRQDHQNGIHGRIMCMRYDLDKLTSNIHSRTTPRSAVRKSKTLTNRKPY